MKKKTLRIFMIILTMILLLITTTKVQAALQSNPTTHYNTSYKKNSPTWIREIRRMEAANGAMGLSEQFNSDLTTKGGETNSNNIDVHMMKSTEYGAITILSTSGYGNPNIMQESAPEKSTTGNKTGVYYTTTGSNDEGHIEWIAGGYGNVFSGVNTRYYDLYKKNELKIGDTMNLKWQGTTSTIYYYEGYPYFGRNYHGYFGFYNSGNTTGCFSRGVAVCGVGF